jgi:hypothetical protein
MTHQPSDKDNAKQSTRRIVGFSLSLELASKIKAEAGRRQIRLKSLLEEMWLLYERHPAKGKL